MLHPKCLCGCQRKRKTTMMMTRTAINRWELPRLLQLLLLLSTVTFHTSLFWLTTCQASTVTNGGRRRYLNSLHNRHHHQSPTFSTTALSPPPTDPLASLCNRQTSSTTMNTVNPEQRGFEEEEKEENDQKTRQQQQQEFDSTTTELPPAMKTSPFWPPWPFNLIQSSSKTTTKKNTTKSGSTTAASSTSSSTSVSSLQTRPSSSSSFSVASLMWTFGYQTLKASFRNIQEIGSLLWFHFPPAAPPLMVLASIPQRYGSSTSSTSTITTTTSLIVPIWSNPFVRNMVLSSFGLAILSWAHSEWTRRRKLTLLPLSSRYIDMNRVVLPPFLPEAVTTPYFNAIQEGEDYDDDDEDDEDDENPGEIQSPELSGQKSQRQKTRPVLPSQLQRHWKQLRGKVPKPGSLASALQDWRNMRQVQKSERKNAHRLLIYDELLAMQTLKKKADRRHEHHQHQQRQRNNDNNNNKSNKSNTSPSSGEPSSSTTDAASSKRPSNELGYALVTGASKGIGRAIAVELARWEIPLILVARDVDALVELACDIEACYGVSCCVLQADLARPETAQAIYQTVKDAGLKVDILINNAGVSSQGQSLRMSLDQINRMIQVNAASVATLTHLFGRDMKERRRGRILMVSSICGAVSGIASVAVYSATKAFENSFGISIGKELEPYGVGVTCLLPGAVRDTEFRKQSNSAEALCWKFPFYAKTAPFVAHMGVRAMLRGETEVTPGVLNRIFLKVVKPILPQRMHNLIAEIAWSPLRMPWDKKHAADDWEDTHSVSSFVDEAQRTNKQMAKPVRPQAYGYRELPPRILKLPEPEPVILQIEEATISKEDNNETSTVDMDAIENNDKGATVAEVDPALKPLNMVSTTQSLPDTHSVPTHEEQGRQNETLKPAPHPIPVEQKPVRVPEQLTIQRPQMHPKVDTKKSRKFPRESQDNTVETNVQGSKQSQKVTANEESIAPVQKLEEILKSVTSGSEFHSTFSHPTEKQGIFCDRVTGICQ